MSKEVKAVAVEEIEVDLNQPQPQEPQTSGGIEIPDNKYTRYYFELGYVVQEFWTREKEAAKTESIRLRVEESMQSVYLTCKSGWFCLLARPAEKKPVAARKEARPPVPVSFEGLEFASGKEARTYASRLVEAARNAEFDYDLNQK